MWSIQKRRNQSILLHAFCSLPIVIHFVQSVKTIHWTHCGNRSDWQTNVHTSPVLQVLEIGWKEGRWSGKSFSAPKNHKNEKGAGYINEYAIISIIDDDDYCRFRFIKLFSSCSCFYNIYCTYCQMWKYDVQQIDNNPQKSSSCSLKAYKKPFENWGRFML